MENKTANHQTAQTAKIISGFSSSHSLSDPLFVENTQEKLLSLVGHQKTLFLFILRKCVKLDSHRSSRLYTWRLREVLGRSSQAIHSSPGCLSRLASNTLQRLIAKGLLFRLQGAGKPGPLGYTVVTFPPEVFVIGKALLEGKPFEVKQKNSDLDQKRGAPESLPGVLDKPPGTKLHCYARSSSIHQIEKKENQKTTFDAVEAEAEQRAWKKIQIPESVIKIGMTAKHLVSFRKGLKASEMQEYLEYFAFDLEQNKIVQKNKIRNPVAYFCGILRKNGPYVIPSNFVSEAERKKREAKAQAEREKAHEEALRKEQEDKVWQEKNEKFLKWYETASLEEKYALLPPYRLEAGEVTFDNKPEYDHSHPMYKFQLREAFFEKRGFFSQEDQPNQSETSLAKTVAHIWTNDHKKSLEKESQPPQPSSLKMTRLGSLLPLLGKGIFKQL